MNKPDAITKSFFGHAYYVRNRVYMAWLHDMIAAGQLKIPNTPEGFTGAVWTNSVIELHHFAKEGRQNDFAVVPVRKPVHDWVGGSSKNNESAAESLYAFANKAVELFALRDFFAFVGEGGSMVFEHYSDRKLAFDKLNQACSNKFPCTHKEQFYKVMLPWVCDNQDRLLLGVEK